VCGEETCNFEVCSLSHFIKTIQFVKFDTLQACSIW